MTDDLVKSLWDDRVRLDWLEKQLMAIFRMEFGRQRWLTTIESHGGAEYNVSGPTLRETIDAAMAAEAGGQPADPHRHV